MKTGKRECSKMWQGKIKLKTAAGERRDCTKRGWMKVRGARGEMCWGDEGQRQAQRGWKGEEPRRNGWKEWESVSMTMTERAGDWVWMKDRQKGMNPCGTQNERHYILSVWMYIFYFVPPFPFTAVHLFIHLSPFMLLS